MPAIQPPAKVLVTGANGFIAVWLLKALLEQGYSVRGTVRSYSKGEHLESLFRPFYDDGRFEIVEVPDFETPCAFDRAVEGVDGIIHTATLVTLKAHNPEGEPRLLSP